MPLFCISSDYTPEAITAMRNNPNTNRREATEQLLEAAGAKLIAMYGRIENGPGTLVILECNDLHMVPAILSVAKSSGTGENIRIQRLVSMDEVVTIEQNAQKLLGAYKAPGQQ
jgi:uncharacterized protein with GYD domain